MWAERLGGIKGIFREPKTKIEPQMNLIYI